MAPNLRLVSPLLTCHSHNAVTMQAHMEFSLQLLRCSPAKEAVKALLMQAQNPQSDTTTMPLLRRYDGTPLGCDAQWTLACACLGSFHALQETLWAHA